jgi:hypothetical protein
MMAKVTFTLEDMPNGTVKTVLTPSGETLLSKVASHGAESLTAAEGYAMFLVNQLRVASKAQTSRIIVPMPRYGKR